MIDLSEREKAIVALGLAAGLVVGLWAGLWMLPAEALSVPTHERESGGQTVTSPAFYPVPSSYMLVTVLAPLGAAWYAHLKTRADPDPTGELSPATDGGTNLEDATDDELRDAINGETHD